MEGQDCSARCEGEKLGVVRGAGEKSNNERHTLYILSVIKKQVALRGPIGSCQHFRNAPNFDAT